MCANICKHVRTHASMHACAYIFHERATLIFLNSIQHFFPVNAQLCTS